MKECNPSVRTGATGLIFLVLILCVSCTKLPKPDFSYAPTDNPEAGEPIQFINETSEATSFSWDFGDGTSSVLENPEHIFMQSGKYGVKLTVYNDGAEKSIIKSVIINDPTILAFLVTESTGKYVIPGASVLVYDNKADWDAINDPQFLVTSGDDGYAIFINMEPINYYVIVVLADVGGWWYYTGYTGAIHQNMDNVFNAPCYWVPDAKKGTNIEAVLTRLQQK